MAKANPFRELPSVDRLLSDVRLRALVNGGESGIATILVRQAIESGRQAIAGGNEAPTKDQLVEIVLGLATAVFEPSLRPVINATGVIIHTNLGRAPLSADAIDAMAAVSRGYSNLEFDLEAGERGSRYTHLESVLTRLTGAEAAIAVNNNASALLLMLSALAYDGEVVISRGQAVEIGGGFRIPDVMAQSGAHLAEIGTTNRTYLRDYESAITEQTVGLMRVHASNFRVVGFTASPSIQELGSLARKRGILLIDDIGSGCLLDTTQFGLALEPTVGESLEAGADLVLFSGDKLLGGPQAGLIVGKSEPISQLRRHPLARAVRMDKASIAALTATLHHYLCGEALSKVPVWRMIAAPLDEIERRVRRWSRALGDSKLRVSTRRGIAKQPAQVIDGRSMIGGGSLPEESLPTKLLAINGDGGYLASLARRLRTGHPPVVARIERDSLLLDPRTVPPQEDRALIQALTAALELD